MARKSRELKAQGVDVISLSLGEPDFFTPDFIIFSIISIFFLSSKKREIFLLAIGPISFISISSSYFTLNNFFILGNLLESIIADTSPTSFIPREYKKLL